MPISNSASSKLRKQPAAFALLALAAFNALTFATRLSFFWETSRIGRLIVLFASGLSCAVAYFALLRLYFTLDKDRNYVALLAAAIYFIFWYSLTSIELPTIFKTEWLGGQGMAIIHAIDLVSCYGFFILLPFWAIDHLSTSKQHKSSSSTGILSQYIFLSIFILLCLLPAIKSSGYHTLNTNFWGYNDLIKRYQSLRMFLGDKVFNNSVLTEDKWYICLQDYRQFDLVYDYQNTKPFSEDELQSIYRKLNDLQVYLDKKGIPLLVVIAPNKNTIYPEYVPSEIPVIGKESRLDQVLKYQKKHNGVEILDLRSTMLNAKKEQKVYFDIDPHWNNYGSLVAYQKIIEEAKKDIPDLLQYSSDSFTYQYTKIFESDTSKSNKFNLPDENPIYVFNGPTKDIIRRDYKLNVGDENTTIISVSNPNVNDNKLVMYIDSFGLALINKFSYNFNESFFIRSYLPTQLDLSFIETEHPDLVIIEFTEGLLSSFMRIPDF